MCRKFQNKQCYYSENNGNVFLFGFSPIKFKKHYCESMNNMNFLNTKKSFIQRDVKTKKTNKNFRSLGKKFTLIIQNLEVHYH